MESLRVPENWTSLNSSPASPPEACTCRGWAKLSRSGLREFRSLVPGRGQASVWSLPASVPVLRTCISRRRCDQLQAHRCVDSVSAGTAVWTSTKRVLAIRTTRQQFGRRLMPSLQGDLLQGDSIVCDPRNESVNGLPLIASVSSVVNDDAPIPRDSQRPNCGRSCPCRKRQVLPVSWRAETVRDEAGPRVPGRCWWRSDK